MSGLVDGFLSAGFGRGLGHGLFAHAAILAPFASPRWAARWVALFAFAQSVHYAMWLRLIPEDARPRRAPRPFRASYRALREDLGAIALALLALATLVFAVWAAFDLIAARDGYLRAAIGHGHLELAAGALLFARGGESVTARRSGRPRARGAAPRRGPRS